jgi:hypothetical protein
MRSRASWWSGDSPSRIEPFAWAARFDPLFLAQHVLTTFSL